MPKKMMAMPGSRGDSAEQPVESKAEKMENILRGFSDFQAMYGKPGVEALTAAMQSPQGLRVEDVKNVMENMATVEEYREAVLQALEQKGVIEKKKDFYVVDLPAIKELPLRQVVNAQKKKWQPFLPYIERGRRYALYLLFKDIKVVSKEDQQNKRQSPKPLFYTPETSDQALDPEAIKQSDFYLGLWEIFDPKADGSLKNKVKEYPCDQEKLNLDEVAIAALIYHPNYGDGYRDESGVLMVKDKKGKHVRFSAQFFRGIGYAGSRTKPDEKVGMHISPLVFIEDYAPNIFTRHVLEPNDIRQYSKLDTNARMRGKKVYQTGDIMLDGIMYSLGRKFCNDDYLVHKLTPNLGGITYLDSDGQQRLTHTFTLVNLNDERLRRISGGRNKILFRAGSDVTAVTPYQAGEAVPRRPDETIEDYQHRLGMLENFEIFLKYKKFFAQQGGISLNALNLSEQQYVVEKFTDLSDLHRQKVLELARKHGGLKALRALLNLSSRNLDRVMEAADKMGPLLFGELLDKHDEIIETAYKTGDQVSREFFQAKQELNDEQTAKLRAELLRRANRVMVDFFENISNAGEEDRGLKLRQVLHELDAVKQDVLIFGGIFKTAFKGSERVDFEQIKDLSFGSFSPADIDDRQKSQMLLIAKENWKQQEKSLPGITDFVAGGLRSKLNSDNQASRFSLLSKGDQVVSFVRFDDRPDLGENAVYAGSLNVSPLMRGSAIGEAVMRNAIDSEAKEHVICADVFPEVQAGTSYVENFGFVITGVEEITVRDPKTKQMGRHKRLLIRRDDAAQTTYKLRNGSLQKDQIMAMAGGQAPGGVEVRRYDLRTEKDKFLNEIAQKTASGMLGTRYVADPHDPNIRYVAFEPASSSVRRAA